MPKLIWVTMCLFLTLGVASVSSAGSKTPTGNASPQVDGILSSVVDHLWAQNDVYWHAGDYERIIALDRIITQADPSFVESYATGAWLMESLGRNDDAEAFYQQGVAHNPQSSYAYYNLAAFYFNTLHDYHAALAVLQKDTAMTQADTNDWRMLAHAYERVGRLAEAVQTWQHIKATWPNAIAVDQNLKRVLARQQSENSVPDLKPAP